MLAFFRFVLGLGMGGEWNTGAALVAETWPAHLRAKAMAIVQSSWAWGYAAASLVAGIILNFHKKLAAGLSGWRNPALVTLWIRTGVPESEMWKQQKNANSQAQPRFVEVFSRDLRKNAILLFLLNFFGGLRMVGTVHLDSALPCLAGG